MLNSVTARPKKSILSSVHVTQNLMKAKVNVLAKPHPYIFITLQLDSVHGSLPKTYHKLHWDHWDEAKTMPCILQHYHKSALTAAHLYNLDPSLSRMQTGHSNQYVKLKYLITALITTSPQH